MSAYRQAIALQPNYPQAYSNLGIALQSKGQLDKSIAACRQAIVLKGDFPEAHSNLGNALKDKGQFDEAAAAYRQAIALKPNFSDAHFHYGKLLVLRGEFAQGWKEWEWRREVRDLAPGLAQPQWTGGDATGRTILLHSEYGFGDTIQFIRYVPMVVQRAARVMVLCQPELRRLMDGYGNAQWLVPGQPLPPFDLHCRLMSLPLVFGTTLQSVPHDVPYLRAAEAPVRRWREKLGRAGGLRVGLTWAASAHDQRSMPFSLLAPLAKVPRVRFYSLQKGSAVTQARQPSLGMTLIDLTDEIHDFADTAALIANLDLVISVDTSVAHLAGAMAKPTWTLLPYGPGWPWLLDRQDSPWYPTMRLFRQDVQGDWRGVVDQVARALAGHHFVSSA